MRTDVKLGKGPAKKDPRRLMLARYFTADLPAPLPDCDYTGGATDWGMMLNDNLGDCTIAAAGHAEQVWSLARKGEYTLPDAAVLQKYEQWCGYVEGDPSTDQGGIETDVLDDWRHSPYFWKHQLSAYGDPDPTDLTEIRQAITLLGGVYIGLQLPVSVQGADIWDVRPGPDAVPGSWGGHAVFVPKYRTDEHGKLIFTCITWGMLVDITQDFWLYNDPTNGPYVDEAHGLAAPEFISLKDGVNPVGLDLAQMIADAQTLSAAAAG